MHTGAPELCGDGSDNDCNGVADCVDPACAQQAACGCVSSSEDCSDGRDDDCDGSVDRFDADCDGTAGCGCAMSKAGACGNWQDDDCDGPQDYDGLIDCAEDDCKANPGYRGECCDGTDQNGNGIPDDFDCRCRSDEDCPMGQLCYTHTLHTCGISCSSHVGDVCPNEVPGSACDSSTLQCEF